VISWVVLYTSQQKKRYKGLILNIVLHREKNRQKSYNLDSYRETNKEISTKFQYHYQNKSWTDRNCHVVGRSGEFQQRV
jgi:hypothetical protein